MTLIKKVEKSINEMKDSIWEYRKNELKDYGVSKREILNEVLELNGGDDGYCNLAWEAGYIYALQQVVREIKDKNSNL